MLFGRFPSGRAIRYNLFLPQAQHKKSISAAIPNANIKGMGTSKSSKKS
jgi:hypothetical protein